MIDAPAHVFCEIEALSSCEPEERDALTRQVILTRGLSVTNTSCEHQPLTYELPFSECEIADLREHGDSERSLLRVLLEHPNSTLMEEVKRILAEGHGTFWADSHRVIFSALEAALSGEVELSDPDRPFPDGTSVMLAVTLDAVRQAGADLEAARDYIDGFATPWSNVDTAGAYALLLSLPTPKRRTLARPRRFRACSDCLRLTVEPGIANSSVSELVQ